MGPGIKTQGRAADAVDFMGYSQEGRPSQEEPCPFPRQVASLSLMTFIPRTDGQDEPPTSPFTQNTWRSILQSLPGRGRSLRLPIQPLQRKSASTYRVGMVPDERNLGTSRILSAWLLTQARKQQKC